MKISSLFGITAGAVLLAATPVSLHSSATPLPSLSVDTADARVGRPLTPMSVAGVHRRAYRRGYYGAGAGLGIAAGALAAGALAAPYAYRYSSYGYPYAGSYGYSGYGYPYAGSYGYYGAPSYYGPRYRGFAWRNW